MPLADITKLISGFYSRTNPTLKDLKFVFDGEFFKNGRRYSMYIGYEQNRPEKFENIEAWKGIIFSNEVKILMKKCN